MRTLVIGLDGVCSSVLDPLIDDDVTPTLGRLRADGAAGPLTSQLPPWTPSAWPSLYTGVNPGKHGVYGFLDFDGYDWDVVNRSHVKEFAVWELLSVHGFSSVVVNVPATHPPRSFDGVLVPGYMAPEEPTCHPEGTWTELQEALGGYSLYGETLDSTATDAALASNLVDLAESRGEAFRHLVADRDPDFGFVQFQATDTVYHQLPDDEAAIRRVYGAVDRAVDEILSACEPDVVLVVSDHGLGPMEGREFRVNDFLRECGYVETTADGEGAPSWKSIARERNREDGDAGGAASLVESALSGAARVGITSQRIGRLLERLGLADLVLDAVPTEVVRAGSEGIDFPASGAYMRVRTEMGVRINLAGREPDGVVPVGEYERVRTELIERLRAVTTPAGDPVFEAVQPREAVFDGPYVEDAPDVVTVPSGFDHLLVSTLKGERFGDPSEPWEHKREGIVVAAGEGVDRGADLADAHLFDVTPTILSTFGLPVGERMDGTVLPVVEATDRGTYDPFSPDRAVATDDGAVEDRLSDLGYLD